MQFDQEFKIGQRVRVVQNEARPWTADWSDGPYVIVGAQLEYLEAGLVNYSIASVDEIEHRRGSTDGFYADSLAPA